MNDPINGGDVPIAKILEPNKKYSWCTCGHSKEQPMCDGSHREAKCTPSLKFSVQEEKEYYLCTCKKTSNPPFCDGSHNN